MIGLSGAALVGVTVVGLSLRPLTVTEARCFKTMSKKERPAAPTARPGGFPAIPACGCSVGVPGADNQVGFVFSDFNDNSKHSDPSALWSSVAIGAQISPDKRIEMVLLENFG